MPTDLAKIYGQRSLAGAIGGWGFDQVFLPGKFSITPGSPRRRRAIASRGGTGITAAAAAEAATAACRPLSARHDGSRGVAASSGAMLQRQAVAPNHGASPRDRTQVRAEILRTSEDVEGDCQYSIERMDNIWKDDVELFDIKGRTQEMRKRTLQLLQRADDAEQELLEVNLPHSDDEPSCTLTPRLEAHLVEDAFRWSLLSREQKRQRLLELEREERRERRLVTTRLHERSSVAGLAALFGVDEEEDDELSRFSRFSIVDPRRSVRASVRKSKSTLGQTLPIGMGGVGGMGGIDSKGNSTRLSVPNTVLSAGLVGSTAAATLDSMLDSPLESTAASTDETAMSGSGPSNPVSGSPFRRIKSERVKPTLEHEERWLRTGSVPSGSSPLKGRRAKRFGSTTRREPRTLTKAGPLHARLMAVDALRKPKADEHLLVESSVFEGQIQIACNAVTPGTKQRSLGGLVKVFEVGVDKWRPLRIQAHMLAANKILEMRVKAENVDHLLDHCISCLRKRKPQGASRADDEACAEGDDPEPIKKRQYDVLGDVLQVDMDQNGRPAALCVPGYETPKPSSEPDPKDALCALAEMFRGKAGAMASRWDDASTNADCEA